MVELLLVGLCGFGWSLSCCRSNLAAVAIGRSRSRRCLLVVEPSPLVGLGAVASVVRGAVAVGRSWSRCCLLVVELSPTVGLIAVAVCWS
jgi:hypothetical protein